MRHVLVAAALAACTGNDISNAKSEVGCGSSWPAVTPPIGTCDFACAEKPTDETGPACDTDLEYTPQGGTRAPIPCTGTQDFDGTRGCCFDFGQTMVIKPGVQEPARTRRVFFLSCK